MTTINRPLTEAERELLLRLTIGSVAEQTGGDEKATADALAHHAAAGRVSMVGDSESVHVEVCGHTLVTAARDWLAFTVIAANVEEADE